MRQLCEQVPLLDRGPSGREIRVAVELLMDTGRRPEEILRLRWDCLHRDPDGAPVLVYDNHKRYRRDRRLPISQATAEVIAAQQARVRERFPDTPLAELVLLPTPHANPAGRRAISGGLLDMRHRTWADRLPALRRDDGTELDKSKIIPYAYRHSYAQRHADAGVPIDVLSQLLDHRTLEVTRRYYRVEEQRRREAVDTVTTLSFDRHGNRIWRDAQALLDSEHARYAVGEVAVPYGTCTEPSNVQAGGDACPVRFRCVGCDHFRTTVAFLPDLQAYLDDLLRTRERLAATVDGVDQWARADATPTAEEITRIRRLITRIHGDIAGLDRRRPSPDRRRRHGGAPSPRRPPRRARHAHHPLRRTQPTHHDGGHRMNATSATRTHGTVVASTRTQAMVDGRRAESTRRRQRVLTALDRAVTDGAEIGVSAIARAAGVDRSFLYRHRDLLEEDPRRRRRATRRQRRRVGGHPGLAASRPARRPRTHPPAQHPRSPPGETPLRHARRARLARVRAGQPTRHRRPPPADHPPRTTGGRPPAPARRTRRRPRRRARHQPRTHGPPQRAQHQQVKVPPATSTTPVAPIT